MLRARCRPAAQGPAIGLWGMRGGPGRQLLGVGGLRASGLMPASRLQGRLGEGLLGWSRKDRCAPGPRWPSPGGCDRR